MVVNVVACLLLIHSKGKTSSVKVKSKVKVKVNGIIQMSSSGSYFILFQFFNIFLYVTYALYIPIIGCWLSWLV